MIVLSCQQIRHSFGADQVLEDVGFTLSDHQRLGLVGPNGAGKTTLLRILMGLQESDGGTMSKAGGLSMEMLQQQDQLDGGETVWQAMESVFEPVFAMERRLREMEAQMGDLHDSDPVAFTRLAEDYAALTDRFEQSGGYGWRSAITGVLRGLGLPPQCEEQPVGQLSGGQRSRLSLAQLLLRRPDILLLDEPTNHLDLSAIAYLENTLRNWPGSVIAVSHDRWFLDAVCDSVAELSFGRVTLYAGNYTAYLNAREERYQQQMLAYKANQKEIARIEAVITRFRSWNREKSIRAAQSWEKQLNRLERVDRPASAPVIHFRLNAAQRSGNEVLRIRDLAMGFDGNPLFDGLELDLNYGDRAALVGPNGVGKTTLLRLITGQLRPLGGEIRLGAGVEVSYYDQLQAGLHTEKTAMDEIWDAHPRLAPQQVRDTLAAFLFRGDDVFKPVSVLSGGEKGRLALLKLMLGRGNLLLLDEPTNHLDMDSRQVLEDALLDFPGTVLFISHDRYFIDRIATHVVEMASEALIVHPGGWNDYLASQAPPTSSAPEPLPPGVTQTQLNREKRRERQEKERQRQRQEALTDLERQIAQTEALIAEAEGLLSRPEDLTAQEVADAGAQHSRLQRQLTEQMAAWEGLAQAQEQEE